MKEMRMYVAAFVTLFLAVPLVVTQIPAVRHAAAAAPAVSRAASAASAAESESSQEVFRVFQTSTGQVANVGAVEYICGVVAAEVPATYHEEALKAQAAAAYTYACHARENNLANPQKNSAIAGADLSDDPSTYEAYLSEAAARVKWGKNFDAQWGRIHSAVEQVAGQVIVWQGKPIDAVFFSASAGRTEDSADVWGDSEPYLKSVDSSFDKNAPDYHSSRQISKDDFAGRVKAKYPAAVFDSDPSKWISAVARSQAGGIKQAKLCGTAVSGETMRILFGLRSTNFTVAYKGGTFTFDVKGNGHGVGMSQYGAEYLAAHGKTWKQILTYYYTGVSFASYQWKATASALS